MLFSRNIKLYLLSFLALLGLTQGVSAQSDDMPMCYDTYMPVNTMVKTKEDIQNSLSHLEELYKKGTLNKKAYKLRKQELEKELKQAE